MKERQYDSYLFLIFVFGNIVWLKQWDLQDDVIPIGWNICGWYPSLILHLVCIEFIQDAMQNSFRINVGSIRKDIHCSFGCWN